jgi:hypothetical protein
MRERCERETDKFFKDYGGRGIKVCDRWKRFENFLNDMGEPPEGMQIDRVDNGGDYEPSNCRWATKEENAQNKRNNRIIEYDGKRMSLSEWERTLGMKSGTLKGRLSLGWAIPKALETPVRRMKC